MTDMKWFLPIRTSSGPDICFTSHPFGSSSEKRSQFNDKNWQKKILKRKESSGLNLHMCNSTPVRVCALVREWAPHSNKRRPRLYAAPMMRDLFELYTIASSQKTNAASIYKQYQSNLLMPNNLFSLITPELRTPISLNRLQ